MFKLAAIGEAVGWSLLIIGITISSKVTIGNRDAVIIAGQLHGVLFMIYLFAALVFSASLRWRLPIAVVAVAVSVIPYGSLIFERWAAKRRALLLARDYRRLYVRALIKKKALVLAVQPDAKTGWQLPGGQVLASETALQALQRLVQAQTGITPKASANPLIMEQVIDSQPALTLKYTLDNPEKFYDVTALKPTDNIEELAFIPPSELV